MSNPYLSFVATLARALGDAAALPKGGLPPAPRPALPGSAPTALILAPHPDDECIIGALPLRLRREAAMRVVNVAVTLGSNRERRPGRRQELIGACEYLGFDLMFPASGDEGLDRVTVRTRAAEPAHWNVLVDAIATILERVRPRVLFLPHAEDWNGTHIGTHFLGLDALTRLGRTFACTVVETEFWGAMSDPNLMVESSAADVADLCAGTAFHVGEVARNPYHVRLPAWMLDNVRRGGELVGGQGGSAPTYGFATLYRMGDWAGDHIEPATTARPRLLGAGENPRALFPGL